MNRPLRPGLLLLLLIVPGCATGHSALDPRDVSFAPVLGIDLDAMTGTSTGLYYQDIVVGTPPAAEPGQDVIVRYRGWLPDGTLFDESPPGEALTFRLGDGMVIEGWDQGVAGMMVGGVRKLVVPPSLGYGARSADAVPPNSVLVFEIQLLAAS